MSKKTYPRRYAQAIFLLAKEHNTLEEWQSHLDVIAGTVSDPVILATLESPRLSHQQKLTLIQPLIEQLTPQAVNFLRLLVQDKGISTAGIIADHYRKLMLDNQGIENALVTTAVPLDADAGERLAERLGALSGKKIQLETAVDPDILGGIIARIGDKLLDGSTRTRLARLKRQLATGEKRR